LIINLFFRTSKIAPSAVNLQYTIRKHAIDNPVRPGLLNEIPNPALVNSKVYVAMNRELKLVDGYFFA
jgi:hypothetical protein